MNNLISIGMQNSLTFSFEKHSHKVWEVTYYYEGTGRNVTAGQEIPFSPGTIICQPPHLIHEDISEGGYKNIYFCVEKFSFDKESPIVFTDTPTTDFLYILKQLYYEFHSHHDHQIIIDSILNVLSNYLVLLVQEAGENNYYIEKFQHELVNNLSNSAFSVTDALKNIPVCPDHFRRMFKSKTGDTPILYQQKMRVNYSAELLKNSTLSIKNIAKMSGFDDPYYFSRVFKKLLGVSPNYYREGEDC